MTSGESGLRLGIVGGGTGGHVVPGLHMLAALAASEELPNPTDLVWFETGRAAEVAAMARLEGLVEGLAIERVRVRIEPRRGGAPSSLRLIARTPGAFLSARRALKRHGTQVLFGLGGFTLLPIVLAARSLGIPIVLLEINALPGRAVRVLAPLATSILHAWPSSMPRDSSLDRQSRHRITGPPMGPDFTRQRSVPESQGTDAWREDLGAAEGAPLLCVLGGSQGAGALNDFVRSSLATLLEAGIVVVHQVGPGRMSEAAAVQPGYIALEFIDDVAGLLAVSTMALSRAGASTLAELAAMGLPAIVVPYPGAGGHQKKNAEQLEGGLLVVEEDLLGQAALDELIVLLGADGDNWRRVAAAALRRRVPRDAALEVARELSSRAKGS